ncbi:cell division protein [Xylocopilactobacillus apicola]|uniref:Poly-beta-1,6-N-acetyl-D-glucosamine biosynthesis protein PgaD n=1 Tax=Xylocopilactobacillus apicola TaxID=2932184 RepID=A0AAU9CVN5_9LACO|nr:cell division protein [Xylocopilactobacillus apicola]BDR58057.1 hypothetical protein XA3_04980 [Xylocopilactobacillus apicola]
MKLVNDDYFKRGHWGMKIGQTLVALIGWCGVLFPFFWVLSPILFASFAHKFKIAHYFDEIQLLKFLGLFFIGYFIFIVIFYFCVTLWNNHRFTHTLNRQIVPNQEKLDQREKVLEAVWTERFGPKDARHDAKFYSVRPDQNLDTHFTARLFKEHEV